MLNFVYSDSSDITKPFAVVPFLKNDITSLNAIGIAGDDLANIVYDKNIPLESSFRVIVGKHILLMVPLDDDLPYKKIKDCFNKIGRELQASEFQLITHHLIFSSLLQQALLHGLYLSQYDIHLYKTGEDKGKTNGAQCTVHVNSGLTVSEFDRINSRAYHIYQAQEVAMNIVNAPSNKLSPQDLASLADQQLTPLNIRVTILDQAQIEAKGLHALLAVNRGSEEPARFIIMEYRPKSDKKLPHFGLVGKGVTFDTGGISLKKSDSMHQMKSDLGGASAVLGALMIAGKQKPMVNITGIIPATDNSIGTKAIKPGDVIDSYLGKTIEIINTDAEGRLILADGLAYMVENFQPDFLIDLATLTGSIVIALGTHASGVFTHSDNIANVLSQTGADIGEKNWRMPLWDDYKEEMDSEIADIKNLGSRPYAGSITAAKFLEYFTSEHKNWVHLDIAAMVLGENKVSKEKIATGYGPHLVYNWIEKMTKSGTKNGIVEKNEQYLKINT